MCLKILSDTPKKLKSYKEGYGWKVFTILNNKLRFKLYAHARSPVVSTGRWLVSNKKRKIEASQFREQYLPRFHIYLKKPIETYNNDRVVKVKFKEPVATGYQHFADVKYPCVVATKMYVSNKETES